MLSGAVRRHHFAASGMGRRSRSEGVCRKVDLSRHSSRCIIGGGADFICVRLGTGTYEVTFRADTWNGNTLPIVVATPVFSTPPVNLRVVGYAAGGGGSLVVDFDNTGVDVNLFFMVTQSWPWPFVFRLRSRVGAWQSAPRALLAHHDACQAARGFSQPDREPLSFPGRKLLFNFHIGTSCQSVICSPGHSRPDGGRERQNSDECCKPIFWCHERTNPFR